jgi:hypothetical protein
MIEVWNGTYGFLGHGYIFGGAWCWHDCNSRCLEGVRVTCDPQEEHDYTQLAKYGDRLFLRITEQGHVF